VKSTRHLVENFCIGILQKLGLLPYVHKQQAAAHALCHEPLAGNFHPCQLDNGAHRDFSGGNINFKKHVLPIAHADTAIQLKAQALLANINYSALLSHFACIVMTFRPQR